MISFTVAVLRGLLLCALFFFVSIVGLQDLLICPGAAGAILRANPLFIPPEQTESGLQAIDVLTPDGEIVTMWHAPAAAKSKPPVLLLHGNSDTVWSMAGVIKSFAEAGHPAYVLDYRGYGRSSGWPSEKGFYIDSESALRLISAREAVEPGKVIPIGQALGSGFALYLAARFQTEQVALVTPYENLRAAIAEDKFFKVLAPLSWWRIPADKFTAQLRDTCVSTVFGTRDEMLGKRHAEALRGHYHGSKEFLTLPGEGANQTDIWTKAIHTVQSGIDQCASMKSALSVASPPA